MDIKGQIGPDTIIVDDFNTHFHQLIESDKKKSTKIIWINYQS
jgi:hypothetical protein